MKVKVCGITREEDIVKLLDLDIDFIGFNLLANSVRKVDLDWALKMSDKYRLEKKSVFLVDYNMSEFSQLSNTTTFHMQIYNFREVPDISNKLFIPINATFLKQLKIPNVPQDQKNRYLVDNMEGALGGTGKKFDWSNLHEHDLSKIMLAGGIGMEDIEFLKKLNVWGIDVNSRFEIEPGKKNHNLLESLRKINE